MKYFLHAKFIIYSRSSFPEDADESAEIFFSCRGENKFLLKGKYNSFVEA